jgi:pimeloyl-ACP methyl ester carboxylesterase
MDIANVNEVEIEYEVVGRGEPVLLISPVLADGFVPLLSTAALADRYQLIRYHKRGWVGSSHTTPPVSIETHADDAAALLDHLGVRRAHVAGHSSGAAVAAELAIRHPDMVSTVVLLELSLLSVPAGDDFFAAVGPAFDAYQQRDHELAFARFMSTVSGVDWAACRDVLDERLPGCVDQAVADADTFFGVELPGLAAWTFDRARAATIQHPVLSVLGANTQPLWVEVAAFLRSSIPHLTEVTIDGVGHLLHIERPEPVADATAAFFAHAAVPAD